jgi:hypothetical protein
MQLSSRSLRLQRCRLHGRGACVARAGKDQKNTGYYFEYEAVEPGEGVPQELMPGLCC